MVPLIQDEIVDKRKWIDKEDFIDLLALAQSVPGIFAVNISKNLALGRPYVVLKRNPPEPGAAAPVCVNLYLGVPEGFVNPVPYASLYIFTVPPPALL